MIGVFAGMPAVNIAFHCAFTTATAAPGTYDTKSPEAFVTKYTAVALGHPEAVTRSAFDPPLNTPSPNPLAGSFPPSNVGVVGCATGVAVTLGAGVAVAVGTGVTWLGGLFAVKYTAIAGHVVPSGPSTMPMLMPVVSAAPSPVQGWAPESDASNVAPTS